MALHSRALHRGSAARVVPPPPDGTVVAGLRPPVGTVVAALRPPGGMVVAVLRPPDGTIVAAICCDASRDPAQGYLAHKKTHPP